MLLSIYLKRNFFGEYRCVCGGIIWNCLVWFGLVWSGLVWFGWNHFLSYAAFGMVRLTPHFYFDSNGLRFSSMSRAN